MGHAFVRDPDGNFTTFDAPDESFIPVVESINNNGDIAGYLLDQTGNPAHGFVRSARGTFTTFDAPGSGTMADTINLKGETAGIFYSVNGKSLSFIRKRNGKIVTFHVPNSKGYTVTESINASGAVAGTTYLRVAKNSFRIFGFIRTP
jgi:hypothetical protein